MYLFRCATCLSEKTRENFNNDKSVKRGHHRHCKACMRIRQRDYARAPDKVEERRRKYKEIRLDPEKNAEYEAKYRNIPLNRHLWHGAKNRARNTKLPFNLEIGDIVIPEFCPLLGIPLEKGPGRIHDNSPSLDRLFPLLGYVKGNIMVISYRANRIKQNSHPDELELLAFNLRKILLGDDS